MTDLAPTSPVATPAAPCCAVADPATQGACALCARPTCTSCRGVVNGRSVCAACLAQVMAEIEGETANAAHLPGAIGGGVVGALLGGAAWAGIAIATNLAIGYVAIGVGFLAGMGVFLGARKKKGKQLAVVAVLCALLGLLLGKYFIVAHVLIEKFPEADLSYVDTRLFRVFAEHITEFFRPFDLLWMFLALGAAHRVVRPTLTQVRVRASR